jgi:hypothetical protein
MPGPVRLALWLGGSAPALTRPYVALMGRMVGNPDSIAKGIGSLLPDDELALLETPRFDGFFANFDEMVKNGSDGAYWDARSFLGEWGSNVQTSRCRSPSSTAQLIGTCRYKWVSTTEMKYPTLKRLSTTEKATSSCTPVPKRSCANWPRPLSTWMTAGVGLQDLTVIVLDCWVGLAKSVLGDRIVKVHLATQNPPPPRLVRRPPMEVVPSPVP